MATVHRQHRHVSGLAEADEVQFEKPPEMTWHDYVVLLLHIASGIEHALMVQYLYAAYSLDPQRAPASKRKHVAHWQQSILTIAREEMGHLMSVQNVLTLLGGPLSFEREDLPWDSPYYPFPFRLEPLSLGSLACYVFTEMPMRPDDDELTARERDAIIARVKNHVRDHDQRAGRVSDERQRPHHVGKLYERIISIIGDVSLIPETAFQTSTYASQANFDAWGRNYRGGLPPEVAALYDKSEAGREKQKREVPNWKYDAHVLIEPMPTRQAAVVSLKTLAGQGEARHLLPEQRRSRHEPSHFDRFLEIYRQFESEVDASWSPSRPMVANPIVPVAGSAPPQTQFTTITNRRSAQWATLFNLRYRMLLGFLGHTMRLSRVGYAERPNLAGSVMHRVFAEMYNVKALASLLIRRPVADVADPLRAGPPFQLPYTLVLPIVDDDCWRLHRDLLAEATSIAGRLRSEASDEPAVAADETAYLQSQVAADAQTLAWVEQILAGRNRSKGASR